jgi:separase
LDVHIYCQIDAAAAPTLRRELLESIQTKLLANTVKDVLEWPNGVIEAPSATRESRKSRLGFSQLLEDSPSDIYKSYWTTIKARYERQDPREAAKLPDVDLLPENWTIVTICVPDSKDFLYISRVKTNREPQAVRLPLIRNNKLDPNGKLHHLSFDNAMEELKDIIVSSNLNGQTATQIANREKAVRAAWWSERTSLDSRLRILLENIEFCWFGPFKVCISPSETHSKRFVTVFVG